MVNLCKIISVTFLLGYVHISSASEAYPTKSQSLSMSGNFSATDSSAVPETWLRLGRVQINTDGYIPLGGLSDPCSVKNVICNAGFIDLGYNGKASYTVTLIRRPFTVTDDAGNKYTLTIAYPYAPPAIGVTEWNSKGNKTWNTKASINEAFTSPAEEQDTSYAPYTDAQGYCGHLYGCQYYFGIFMHRDSGAPYLYIKLPKNLSPKTITFTDKPVLELSSLIDNQNRNTPAISLGSAYLYLSGSISVPQRCYISQGEKQFDFGSVYSNNANGNAGNKSATVTTSCYYAPQDTKQYIKIEAVSGGELSSESMIYQIADAALGIVFSINNSTQCNSTTDNKNVFNKEYLINTFDYGWNQTKTTTVNFSLCKYGVPKVTGTKNVVLRLTSRWVSE